MNRIIQDIISIVDNRKKINNVLDALNSISGISRNIAYVISKLLSNDILPITNQDKFNKKLFPELNDEEYLMIAEIRNSSDDVAFKAQCSEFLFWTRHAFCDGEKAATLYYDEIKSPSITYEYKHSLFLAVCRVIGCLDKLIFPREDFFNDAISYVEKHSINDSDYGTLFILKALCAAAFDFDIIEFVWQRQILELHNKRKFDRAIVFLKSLCNIYKSKECTEKHKEYLRILADYYWEEAERHINLGKEYYINAIFNIKNAIKILQSLKAKRGNEFLQRLYLELHSLEKEYKDSMKPIEIGPIDITEGMKQFKSLVGGFKKDEALLQLAIQFQFVKYDKSLNELKDEDIGVSSLFTMNMIDSNGHVVAVIPSIVNANENQLEDIICYRSTYKYEHTAFLIQYYLRIIQENYEYTEEDIKEIVADNSFVPSDRVDAFTKGLLAGIKMDFITANSILMPQMENAIRIMAETLGVTTFKMNYDTTESCIGLNEILESPEMIDSLDKDYLFNYKLFLTKREGIGMRNIVAHGLYSDKELQGNAGILSWWFCYRICFMYSAKKQELLEKYFADSTKNSNDNSRTVPA